MKRKKGKPDTLEDVLESAWEMIQSGADRSDDPFHWPVLGTLGMEGCNLRSVILREFILPERIIVCHTDARAPKVSEIRNCNRLTWLFYHPQEKVQLRIYGKAELHGDDSFADEQWSSTGITSRLNYAATSPPGTPVDQPTSGLPYFLRTKVPALLESEMSRPNFMSISCKIEAMDWLMLSILGNRRALFTWDNDVMHSRWLIP